MNSTLWYSLGLVLLLCVAFPVLAVGTTFARYRTDADYPLVFEVKENAKVYLGNITVLSEESESEKEEITFAEAETFSWQREGNTAALTLTVANGKTVTESEDKTIRVRLCVIGGAGLWQKDGTAEISLVLPAEEGSEEPETITATAKTINPGTILHSEYGDGWVFTFVDENGKELFWDLKGGEFSYVTFKITANVSQIENSSQLEYRVTAEVIE